MKNKLLWLPLAALMCLVLLSACSGDEDISTPVRNKITITAVQPTTRMGFDSNGKGYWQEGDVIGVWSEDDEKFMPFTIESGVGTAQATFKGEMTGTLSNGIIAVYPYNDNLSLYINSEQTYAELQTVFPSTYTYDGVDTDYSAVDGKSFNEFMAGLIESNGGTGTVYFVNQGSLLAIKIERLMSTEGSIIISAESNICGTVKICEKAADKQWIEYGSDAGKEVTFHYTNATIGQSGVFYVPVLAGTYKVKVKVVEKERNNYEFTNESSSFTLETAHIKRLYVRHDYSTTINGMKAIDMGGTVLWAERNVGATISADKGNYYAWGETVPKEIYTENTYKFTYGDEIDASSDAATVNLGSPWRMPTKGEIGEILNNNTKERISMTNSSGEAVEVYKLTSKTKQNYICVPCTGSIYDTEVINYWRSLFWSTTPETDWLEGMVYHFSCDEEYGACFSSTTCYNGMPVRGVAPIHDVKP